MLASFGPRQCVEGIEGKTVETFFKKRVSRGRLKVRFVLKE
jgi:hypothetical protein